MAMGIVESNAMTQLILILVLIVAGFTSLAWFIRHRTIQLRDQLDGRLTELLTVTKKLARAEGVAEGRAEEREERNHNE